MNAQELNNMWVTEGTHQLTFPHKLSGGLCNSGGRDLGSVLEEIMAAQMAPGMATSSTLP